MTFPIIDAHQHVWDPSMAEYDWLDASLAPVNRAMGFEELEPKLTAAGVDFTVMVQSADNPEDTALMVATAQRHERVAAIVGYAPLGDPAGTAATIASWAGDSRFVGVRNLIHTIPDTEWLLRPEVDESLGVLEDAGLTFDVVAVLPRHLELVPILSERHPRLRMVIDHLASPPIGLSDRQPWWDLIAAAADNPLVSAKVSGLYSATGDLASWTPDAIKPYVDRALELFGPQRLMYGGDWPISVLGGDYARVWAGLGEILATLDESERSAILGATAASFYRIDPARLDAARLPRPII